MGDPVIVHLTLGWTYICLWLRAIYFIVVMFFCCCFFYKWVRVYPPAFQCYCLLYVCMDIALRNTFLVEDLLNKESESESDHLVVRLDEVWTLLYFSPTPTSHNIHTPDTKPPGNLVPCSAASGASRRLTIPRNDNHIPLATCYEFCWKWDHRLVADICSRLIKQLRCHWVSTESNA